MRKSWLGITAFASRLASDGGRLFSPRCTPPARSERATSSRSFTRMRAEAPLRAGDFAARSKTSCASEVQSLPERSFSRKRLHLARARSFRSEEHTSELQSRGHLVCRLLLEKKNNSSR